MLKNHAEYDKNKLCIKSKIEILYVLTFQFFRTKNGYFYTYRNYRRAFRDNAHIKFVCLFFSLKFFGKNAILPNILIIPPNFGNYVMYTNKFVITVCIKITVSRSKIVKCKDT